MNLQKFKRPKKTKFSAQDSPEDVRTERDWLKAVMSSMAEGLLVVDKNYRVTFVNPIALKLLGIKDIGELLEKNLLDAVSLFEADEKIKPEDRPIAKALREGKTTIIGVEKSFFYQKGSGQKIAIAASVAPIITGAITGAVMVFSDVTVEREIEDIKSNFISIASHQLRTPLTSMRWFLEMLLSSDAGTISPQQKHFVTRAYQGTERMIKLVGLLLKLAQVEAGKISISPEPVELKALLEETFRSFDSALFPQPFRISYCLKPDPFPKMNLDKEAFRLVTKNILFNAAIYSPQEKPIKVAIIKKEKEIEVSVEDKGVGISKKDQPKIFEKFFRAESAVSLAPDGWGLNLALAKNIVEAWGGKIWFTSAEGKGTTFYFTIPFSGMKAVKGWANLAT